MLTIKLSRFGKKKQPTYRILVLEKSKDPWGDYLEMLGHYNPRSKELKLNIERVKYWISKGAKPTDSMHNMLVSQGVIEGKKKRVSRLSKERKTKLEKKKNEKSKTAEKPAEPTA